MRKLYSVIFLVLLLIQSIEGLRLRANKICTSCDNGNMVLLQNEKVQNAEKKGIFGKIFGFNLIKGIVNAIKNKKKKK